MQAYRNAQTLYTQLRRVARLMGVSAQVAVSLVIVDLARRHPAEAAALIALAYGADYTLSRAGNVVRRRASSVARGARTIAGRSIRGAASSMRRSVRASPRRVNN
jgi:hypothetical protein